MKNFSWPIKVFIVWCCSGLVFAGGGKAFIVDTDVLRDDIIAMLYLFKVPAISVKAITIETNDDAHCQVAFRNVVGILGLVGLRNVPVACGIAVGGKHVVADPQLVKVDRFLASTAGMFPRSSLRVNYDGPRLLVKTLNASKGRVNIIALGQLTNIAEAFKLDPTIKNKIEKIYVMGGAVHVAGNMDRELASQKYLAEWNLHFDPAASAVVLANLPVVLVPLDATNEAPLNERFLRVFSGSSGSRAYGFLYKLLKNSMVSLRSGLWFFWDPMTAVVATDEGVCEFRVERLRVVKKSDEWAQAGATVVDNDKGSLVKVCEKVKVEEFERRLLAVIRA